MGKDNDWLDLDAQHKFAQDNRLITAQYSRGLSLIGQKLVRLAIANVNSMNDDDFFLYRVKLIDIAKLLGVEQQKHIYRDVKKASAELLETKMLVEDKSRKNSCSYRRYNLFSYFDYNDGTGTVTIKFNEDMREFLLHLRKNFTNIPLEQIIFMNHKYSIKVYELIQMKLRNAKVFADKHQQIEVTVEEIRKATSTENSYKQIAELKKRVIAPAIEDIEKNAYYHCEFRDIKDGRSIVGFEVDVWSVSGWNYMQLQKGQLDGQMSMLDFIPEDKQ